MTEYGVQSYDQLETLQEEFSKLTKLRTKKLEGILEMYQSRMVTLLTQKEVKLSGSDIFPPLPVVRSAYFFLPFSI